MGKVSKFKKEAVKEDKDEQKKYRFMKEGADKCGVCVCNSCDDYENMCKVIGNNDSFSGMVMLEKISKKIAEAREKHMFFERNEIKCAIAVLCEANELMASVCLEGKERRIEEAIDVIVTAMRYINREYERSV